MLTVWRRLPPALVLAVLVVSALVAIPATAGATTVPAPRSGKLLLEGGVLTPLAGRSTPLRFATYCPQASFSPDGSMIATVERRSVCGRGQITIERARGHALRLPRLAGRNGAITWSPDGRQVATYVDAAAGTGIYAQGVDGSAPRLVYDPASGPVQILDRDVSWSPDGDRIVFVGTDKGRIDAHGRSRGADRSYRDQLWTVPADGGAPEPYNSAFVDPGCAVVGGTCRTLSYNTPRWSPDGSTVLVRVDDVTVTGNRPTLGSSSVATISQDAAQPTVVHELGRRDAAHPSASPWKTTLGFTSFWSADGRAVVSQIAVPGQSRYRPGFSRWVRVDVATGDATPVGDRYADVYDWQPCPTGTCVAWPTVRPARISFAVHRRTGSDIRYELTGRVRPGQRGWVMVAMEVRRGDGGWVRLFDDVARRHGTRFDARIGRSRTTAHACRFVVTFRVATREVKPVRC